MVQQLFTVARKNALAVILLIAFLARLAAALLLGNTVSGLSGAHDEISYSMLGQRFATGHGMTFPTEWYPWIKADAAQSYYSYTISLFLAGIYAVAGYQPLVARLIMALLSVLMVFMIYLVARRLFSERTALIASALAALYTYLIFYGVTLVTETPFTLALLVAVYLVLRIKEQQATGLGTWLLLGVVLAVTVLLRMAVIFFIPILLLWLASERRQQRQFYQYLLPLAVIALAIAPFTVRNYLLWGHFSLLETQFGHVFWNGNHPGHLGDFHPYKVFPIPAEVLASQNDVAITNQLLRLGVANVLADPWHFLQLTLTRLREFFTFWPTADSGWLQNLLRLISFGLVAPLAVIGLFANGRRLRSLAPLYLFIVIHTGIYAVTWTMIRYRMPLEPFLIMFAAYTIEQIYVSWWMPLLAQLRAKIVVPSGSEA